VQSLADHQRWLASLILEPDRLDGDAGDAVRPIALDDVETARVRLGAYVGGYRARLVEAMEEAFPALLTILGNDAFRGLVHRYRVAVPRGIYSLSDVGKNLPAFLVGDQATVRLPFLTDLATLEWACLRAFHAFERDPLDPAVVAGWGLGDWRGAELIFQSGVAVVRSEWPILDLWNLRDTPPEARGGIDLAVEGRPQSVLVRRAGLGVFCDPLSPPQAQVLAALLGGAQLGKAMDALAEASDEPLDVATWFTEWRARGLIVDCRAG
jgi:hypothetical protein